MKPKSALRGFLTISGSALLFASQVDAATLYWDGGNGSWATITNWSTASGATTPDPGAIASSADDAIFNVTTANLAQNITLDGDQSVKSLTFNNTGTTNIRGNTSGTTARTLTIGSGGIAINAGAGAVTIGDTPATYGAVNLSLGAAQSWINNSKNLLTVTGTVTNGSNLLTIGGAGRTTISGVIGSGSGGLTKNDAGTLTLSNTSNTYTGATTINGGVLEIATLASGGAASSLGAATTSASNLVLNGGTLRYIGTTATNTNRLFTLASSSTIENNGSNTMGLNATGSVDFTGATGPVTLTLSGSNTGTNNNFFPILGDVDGSNKTSLAKSGAIQWNIRGSNGYTGTTTIGTNAANANSSILNISDASGALTGTNQINLTGGQLRMTNLTTETGVNRVNDSAAIASIGGAIVYANTAGSGIVYSETLGNLTLNAGFTAVMFANNANGGGGNTQTLQFGNLTHNNFSVVSFGAPGVPGALTGTSILKFSNYTTDLKTSGNIIGPWAIAGNQTSQSDYATVDSTGRVVYLGAGNTAEGTGWSTGKNITTTTASTSLSATRTINTLRANVSNGALELNGNNLETYGILAAQTYTVNAAVGGNITIPNAGGDSALYLFSGNSPLNITAPIKDNTSAVLTLVAGAGLNGNSITLSSTASSYTGGTVISAPIGYGTQGSVKVGASSSGATGPLGSTSGFLQVDSGILNLQTFTVTVGNLKGNAIGTITGSAGSGLTIGNGNTGGGDYQGVLSGSMTLTKTGTGTITLSGANTYTGATNVNAGVLAVNGQLANTTTTVGNAATLRGSGSIAGSVTVQNGGTIAAGNSIESLATGALSLEAGSTFAYEINNDALPGVAGDLTAVTGNLTLDLGNAAILTLSELGSGTWTVGEKLTLISYSGAWNNGLFNYLGGALADDSTFSFSGTDWVFNYNDTSAGNNYTGDLTGTSFVTMTAVPEPRAALLGSLGLLMLLRRRRN